MNNPLDIIKRHFEYLIREYNFQIISEKFSPQIMGNTYITYCSASIGVRVTIDRSQVLINIGDILDSTKEWFDFSDVITFFNSSIENPYIFIEKTYKNKEEDIIEPQVERLASLLHQNCDAMLKGELRMKEKIKDIEKKRIAELLVKFNKRSSRTG